MSSIKKPPDKTHTAGEMRFKYDPKAVVPSLADEVEALCEVPCHCKKCYPKPCEMPCHDLARRVGEMEKRFDSMWEAYKEMPDD